MPATTSTSAMRSRTEKIFSRGSTDSFLALGLDTAVLLVVCGETLLVGAVSVVAMTSGSHASPQRRAWRWGTPVVFLLSGALFMVSAQKSDGTDLRPTRYT